jgi:KaiC/GvpD/RAD55 family RecA-like ATPase
VLGGGLVAGRVVLIGGDPGIGKSTLLLQALARWPGGIRRVYVTGEESGEQVALRAQRLQLDAGPCSCSPRSGSKRSSPRCDRAQARRRGDRFDPDAVLRRAAVGARLGGPGARMRRPADALRQAAGTC